MLLQTRHTYFRKHKRMGAKAEQAVMAEDVISRSRAAELSGERISIFLDQEEEALAMRG